MRFTIVFFIGFSVLSVTTPDITADTLDPASDSWVWTTDDSKKAAQDLAADCLNGSWRTEFTFQTNSIPAVMVDSIRNRSSYHIDTYTLMHYLEEILVNSNRVSVKLDKSEADFIFYGEFNSTIEGSGEEKEILYLVYLELVELKTSKKVWIKTYQTRKPYISQNIAW